MYELGAGVQAFSTRRSGGCSKGLYASFNINEYCGDDPEDVRRNRKALCRQLHLDEDRLVMPHQTHGTKVLCVDEAFFAGSASWRKERLEGVDALITRLPATCIGVSTADCIPVLLYDAGTGAIAAVHAGWRGTVGRIVEKTIDAMADTFGTRSVDVKAVIGPGISLEAFEVGDEVYDTFAAAGLPVSVLARRYSSAGETGGQMKWHIDLWEANRCQLVDKGVPREQIQLSGLCTYFHSDRYFSARRLGVCSGRIWNGIVKV